VKTVLILSDDQDERDLLSRALERGAGWKVTVAPDGISPPGASSAGSPQANPPDVVIVDLELPDAIQVAERWRAGAPQSALVLRSGREPGEVALAGRLSGAVGVLHDDLDARLLGEELGRLISLVGVAESAIGQWRAAAPVAGSASDIGRVSQRLAAHPRSAGEARRALRASLALWDLDALSDDAALLVTELVGNAVSHVGSEVEVSVALRRDVLRVEVADFSPGGAIVASHASDDAEGGRGLAIVESLASRWGVTTHSTGKIVWFELDRNPSTPATRR